MQTLRLLLILTLWYLPGGLAARAMTRRGHDPLPWVYLAWITGALTVLVACAVLLIQRDTPTDPTRSAPEPDRILS